MLNLGTDVDAMKQTMFFESLPNRSPRKLNPRQDLGWTDMDMAKLIYHHNKPLHKDLTIAYLDFCSQNNLDILPTKLLVEILRMLPLRDLCAFAMTHRRGYSALTCSMWPCVTCFNVPLIEKFLCPKCTTFDARSVLIAQIAAKKDKRGLKALLTAMKCDPEVQIRSLCISLTSYNFAPQPEVLKKLEETAAVDCDPVCRKQAALAAKFLRKNLSPKCKKKNPKETIVTQPKKSRRNLENVENIKNVNPTPDSHLYNTSQTNFSNSTTLYF
eukprot:TRINITY_DN6738_c0_g1_i1.p1 TRINITY_DN6738_c0_g1~~TRINITY_DN6738_c0_g1_i1.p1  ORF type:complete len:271 (+),score=26.60 TRINITY_DN6738_c0_g1_i1:27-839(+)